MVLRALLLTGGPAVGKSSTATALAESTRRSAVVDVDDVRQLVKNGGAAPWDGAEGITQQDLGVRNAAGLAGSFLEAGFNVALADVVNVRTLGLFRSLLPGVLVVRLQVELGEARRRAALRRVFLTEAEFEALHREQLEPLAVDVELDVTGLSLAEQVEAVRAVWQRQANGRPNGLAGDVTQLPLGA